MFEIKNAKSFLLRNGRTEEAKTSAASVGSSKVKHRKDDHSPETAVKIDGKFMSTSSLTGNPFTSLSDSSSSGSPNVNISNNALTIDLDPLLTGMTPQTEHVLHRVYKDMYYNDAVCGGMADLNAMLPFSDFNLGGLTMKGSEKVREAYQENIERLNIRTLLPELSIDHQVLGAFVGSLLYNKEDRTFVDIMCHQVENCNIQTLPFYSQEPIIEVDFPSDVREILSRTGSPRIERIKKLLGRTVVDKLASGKLELDPLSTIFLPRRTFTKNDRGTSLFRRVLPIYLIEKNLFRGTIIESARRQRGIMHITVGDGDTWVPTTADMDFISDLFSNADNDPVGAIIATRMGISVEELRQGGDFWKVTDFSDTAQSMKLRAMGASESLLSGEASLATSDNGLVVYLDQLRSYRAGIEHRFFYNKLFPLISLVNGFTVRGNKLEIRENLINEIEPEDAMRILNDGSKLLIPSVVWHKQLKPEGDSSYIDLLDNLTQKGVPVPLRALAAAGGMNLEYLLKQQEEDLEVRKKIADYKKAIDALSPQTQDSEASAAFALSADNQLKSLASVSKGSRSAVHSTRGRRAFLDRDFSTCEPYQLDAHDRVKHVFNGTRFNHKMNDRIVRCMRSLNRRLS